MTTKEAIQAMIDGEKVFLPCWKDPQQYIHFKNSAFREETGEIYVFGDNYTDWEIYEEPKQTITIEKWLCKSAWDNYFILTGEEAFFKTGGYDKQQVKLLDTYEVEL